MTQIHRFNTIEDFSNEVGLYNEKKNPGFLIYNHEHVSHSGFARLPAYRQNYYEINIEFTKGCAIRVDQFELPAAENRITLISPHRLQTLQPSNETTATHKGYGIFFDPEFVNFSFTNSNLLDSFPFFDPQHTPAVAFHHSEAMYIQEIISKVVYEYNNYSEVSQEIIKNYLNILLLKAKRNYTSSGPSPSTRRNLEIYREFQYLIQQHFLTLSSVKGYADKMHISAKHLSETVKEVSGQSALSIIHKSRINFAKALLLQTGKNISEIAYELNFENPEYFSVFFKRMTGKTPVQFRIS